MTSHRAALVALLACVSLVGRCVVADSPTLSAGARHTCAIDGADRLHCWGDDSDGQSTVPADVSGHIQRANAAATAILMAPAGGVIQVQKRKSGKKKQSGAFSKQLEHSPLLQPAFQSVTSH